MLTMTPVEQHSAEIPMNVRLADGQVVLRTYIPDDMQGVYQAARESIAEVGRWLPWCHEDYAISETEEWFAGRPVAWQQGHEYSFLICDAAGGRILGGCGLNQIEWAGRRANLGYWVRTSAVRRGAATAATRLLARWGFETLGLERIEIVAAVGNVASQRVAEKAGAVREAIARRRIRIRDVQHDAVLFSLIRRDLGL